MKATRKVLNDIAGWINHAYEDELLRGAWSNVSLVLVAAGFTTLIQRVIRQSWAYFLHFHLDKSTDHI